MRAIDADWFKSVMLDEPTEWMTEEQLVQFRAMIDLAPTICVTYNGECEKE